MSIALLYCAANVSTPDVSSTSLSQLQFELIQVIQFYSYTQFITISVLVPLQLHFG